MALTPEENRAADRRNLGVMASHVFAGGNTTMTPRHAVEVAMEIDAVIREAMGPFAARRVA